MDEQRKITCFFGDYIWEYPNPDDSSNLCLNDSYETERMRCEYDHKLYSSGLSVGV